MFSKIDTWRKKHRQYVKWNMFLQVYKLSESEFVLEQTQIQVGV